LHHTAKAPPRMQQQPNSEKAAHSKSGRHRLCFPSHIGATV
jgi:hypothetical protein